jgi:hypothetical protein
MAIGTQEFAFQNFLLDYSPRSVAVLADLKVLLTVVVELKGCWTP